MDDVDLHAMTLDDPSFQLHKTDPAILSDRLPKAEKNCIS